MNFALLQLKPQTSAESKISAFSNLPSGWHYGRGEAPSQPIIDSALSFCRLFYQLGLTRADAFAGEGGEIMLAAYHDADYLEVIVETDGTFTIVHESSNEELAYVPRASRADAIRAIVNIAAEICGTSDLFILNITIETRNASLAWRFGPPATLEYQLLVPNAYPRRAPVFASTPENTTNQSPTPISFSSGALMIPSSQPEAA